MTKYKFAAVRVLVFVAAALSFLAATTPVSAQYALKTRRDFRSGQHPVGVVAADYDGDGNIDLMTADELSGYISLMKGFGDGTFRQVGTVVAGSEPTKVAFVDVNHDSYPDIVACNYLSQDVTVNLGNGHGIFGLKIRSLVSATPFGLAMGDWNNDTHLDVATVNDNPGSTPDNISILRGNGSGSFSNLTQITVGIAPTSILTSDFNADGKADLVVVNSGSNTIQVWRGDGLGGFTLNTTLSPGAGTTPVSATAADLNADGRPDLVVACKDAGNLRVYLANTTGGFNTPSTLTPGFGPRAVLVDDINKDAKPDLLVAMSQVSGVGELAVMIGNGTGGFGTPTVTSTGPSPTVLTSADFNKDGNLDIATASLTGNELSILETTATGVFVVAGKVTLASGSFPTAIVVADFNRDGKPDVAATSEGANQVAVARGDGLGGFLAPTVLSTGNNSAPGALAVIDTNRDGAPDLVTMNGANTMSVLQNNGAGTLSATNGISIGTCNEPVAVASGEISGDLNPDIAFVCDVSYQLCTRRGTGGTGSGAFGAVVCTATDPVPEGIALGNFNFDALNDAAFSSQTSGWVDVAFSDGAGGVTDIPSTFPTGTDPRGVARGDLNNDGFDDIVVASSGSDTISALLGDGGGGFSYPSIESPAGEAPNNIALVDLNLDGKLDAAVVNTNANNVSFLLGDGFGHFSKAGDFGSRDLPLAIGAGDFNLDGKPDLAVADNYADSLTILLNQSVLGDPLAMTSVLGQDASVFRWGLVPGAVYDVIRGQIKLVTQGPGSINLGPVTCIADDLPDTDTTAFADSAVPPVGDVFFYLVRPVIGGVAGQYSVSTTGKPAIPASGGCF